MSAAAGTNEAERNERSTAEVKQPVRCRGVWRGGRCGKILGRGLTGVVELKCSRCRFVGWYGDEST